MNLQLLQNKSTLQPKKGHQRDPYIGALHPQSKKRHGKGNYQYKNKFFQYEGEYVNGKKQGQGVLKLNDGTKIEAIFVEDQIQGNGKITCPDGSSYEGQLQNGQRNGNGRFQSIFQIYQGEWRSNSKHGKGRHQILSTGQVFQGTYQNNKLYGLGYLKSYNYQYNGSWINGKRQGEGLQVSHWRRVDQQQGSSEGQVNKANNKKQINYDSYQYKGSFLNNKFHDSGVYHSLCSNYIYEGQFIQGLPKNYPNQFRIYLSSNIKNQNGQMTQTDKLLIDANTLLDYQLQGDSKNIYIQCVYQGPQYLDENQPTEEEIQLLVKNWQNQNKKNKNPPPMPDFRQPKMKKPELILINQENHRQITVTLQKQSAQSKRDKLKIDYRKQISQKRAQIQKLKQQAKKNQDEDPKKKGGKKQAKNQSEYKINAFKQNPLRKQKQLNLQTQKGITIFKGFQLPDDFPQGKYFFNIQSRFSDFGKIQSRIIQLNIKVKQAVGKKK